MEIWGITDRGKVRRQNQDVFKTVHYPECDTFVLAVCDGMGGANAGNVASALAVETFFKCISETVKNSAGLSNVKKIINDAVAMANCAVFERSTTSNELHGMGTTLTAAVSAPDGETIANIGDSRAYHITETAIRQITKDHSVVEDMIDRGDITKEEARIHPNKNLITRALGTCRTEHPDVFKLKLRRGEYLLLCTDGLTNLVSDNEILQELQSGKSVRTNCEVLLGLAISRGAPDNVTVVLLRK